MESIFFFLNTIRSHALQRMRGFSLVEMLIVLAIMVTITAIALFGQGTFNRTLVLTDTTYNLAFTIRQAQSLGLSSRAIGTVTNAGYGVHIKTGSTDAYTLFADTKPDSPGSSSGGICSGHTAALGDPDAKPGDCIYDNSVEKVTGTSLTRGFTISKFCEIGVPNPRCSGSDFDSLDIMFVRPNTQSIITGVRGNVLTPLTNVSVTIASPDGAETRCVVVTQVGQIAVSTTACP